MVVFGTNCTPKQNAPGSDLMIDPELQIQQDLLFPALFLFLTQFFQLLLTDRQENITIVSSRKLTAADTIETVDGHKTA